MIISYDGSRARKYSDTSKGREQFPQHYATLTNLKKGRLGMIPHNNYDSSGVTVRSVYLVP